MPNQTGEATHQRAACCGALSCAVQMTMQLGRKEIPVRIVAISPDGQIIGE
ncbi:MAG: hypothetical protein IKK34_11865 [Clostridia bacterium]|nr:hypothetical protein [Clostridia bacterium]